MLKVLKKYQQPWPLIWKKLKTWKKWKKNFNSKSMKQVLVPALKNIFQEQRPISQCSRSWKNADLKKQIQNLKMKYDRQISILNQGSKFYSISQAQRPKSQCSRCWKKYQQPWPIIARRQKALSLSASNSIMRLGRNYAFLALGSDILTT